MKRTLIATLTLLGLGIASCSQPTLPVSSGDEAYGALAQKDMREYYYPTQAGWTYVYLNTIQQYSGTGNTILTTHVGSYDTLRTLGLSHVTVTGDSMYMMDVTYRVLTTHDHKNRFQLYYFKQGQSNNGGFIVGNDPSTINRSLLDSISSVAASIDTILYATEGPTRDAIDNPTATGNRVTRTDRIFYTAKGDSVSLWFKEGTSFRKLRQLWYKEFDKNDDWRYSDWDNYTYFKVRDEDVNIATPAGVFTSAEIDVITEDLNTPVKEQKFWGRGVGLVKQYDEWRVSSDGGSSYHKRTKVRELISRSLNVTQ